MSKVKLFIATSIDGYIARKNNSLDWLYNLENPNKLDHGYNALISNTDVIVMGRKTYEEILGFELDWPYEDCKTHIVTTHKNYAVKTDNTFVLNTLNPEQINSLRKSSKKGIWLVGGGSVVTEFLNHDGIDEMTITLIPILLGEGISLFPNNPKETKFDLVDATSFETGAVNLTYKRKL